MNFVKLFFLSCTIGLTAHAMQQPHDDLIEAAKHGNLELVRHLLDAGAEIDLQDIYGNAALISAACNGHSACLQLLLQAGAKVNLQDMSGYTALMWAVYDGHTNCLQLLLQAGAKVDHQSQSGGTALMAAVYYGHQSCCYLLLDRMMQLPSDAQKRKVYTFLWCMKQYGLDHNMRRYIKPYLLAAIEEENYETPEQSFAWQEVLSVDQSKWQSLFDYLKRKQSKINKIEVDQDNRQLLLDYLKRKQSKVKKTARCTIQ